ncbi:SMI1/KNR4 family protein [Flavobacterium olei]|uniref:SMI1/KNR4 family protein n=1 Tax=Flavobacterium olei TaxID=1886782 RepID=UPI00321BF031
MTIQEIETKYNFKFPDLYKELDADGMLDVGEYGPNWYLEVYPTLKDNPPLLLHSYDFESLNLKSVAEEIEELRDPEDYRNINPELKFIPFAKSGGGDHYCFFLNEENNADVPIVFVWHDMNEVNYLAKNLQDFIFKVLLIDMSKKDIYNELSDEEFRNEIQSVFKSHKKYLNERQISILEEIMTRKIVEYEIHVSPKIIESARGLLTDSELESIVNKVIPFDKMNQSFKYSND